MQIILSSTTPSPFLHALKKMNHELILLPPNPRLPLPVCSHADMLMYRCHDGTLLCEASYFEENRSFFEKYNLPILPCNQQLGKKYPQDIAYNVLTIGDTLFGLRHATAPEILTTGRMVHVKQGYARCSCLALPDRSIITADPSLATAFEREKISYLKIEEGRITLPGYNTGFIGGASGVLDERTVLFFGSLRYHKDGKKTAAFLKEHGCDVIELCDCQLYDVGGIITL